VPKIEFKKLCAFAPLWQKFIVNKSIKKLCAFAPLWQK